MIYFNVRDLIGSDSVDAYNYYEFQVNWIRANVLLENWQFDYSHTLCINGVNIPCGINFVNFNDAYRFCKTGR